MSTLDELFDGVFDDIQSPRQETQTVRPRKPKTYHRYKFLDRFKTDEEKAQDLRHQYAIFQSLFKMAVHYKASTMSVRNAMDYFKVARNSAGGRRDYHHNSAYYTYKGETATLRDLVKKYSSVSLPNVRCRLWRGMRLDRALTMPKQHS